MDNLGDLEALKPASSQQFFEALSDHEFRNVLSAWFEEKGIVSELRSQVRFKMIHVLKNTTIGKDIARKTSQCTNLSKQALNLIVADHLLRNQYQYSLSIFSTEASVMNMFPEYPNLLNVKVFHRENVLKILDMVGLPKGSWISDGILKMYHDTEDESLIMCLFRWLSKKTFWAEGSGVFKALDLTDDPLLIKQLANLLIEYDLSFDSYKRIVENTKKSYRAEMATLKHHHYVEVAALQKELVVQERKVKDLNKVRKSLEHNLDDICKEYECFKSQKLDVKRTDSVPNVNLICTMPHCTEMCRQQLDIIKNLDKENKHLKQQNLQQNEKNFRISKEYDHLNRRLIDYKTKIDFLSASINNNSGKCVTEPANDNSSDVSSESITEEIIREARLRLKMLEDENKQIEEMRLSRLSNLV